MPLVLSSFCLTQSVKEKYNVSVKRIYLSDPFIGTDESDNTHLITRCAIENK